MFGALPSYRSYSPYLHSSYHQPFPYHNQRSVNEDRARALAARRAKRAQWLPDEDDDYDDDDYEYNQLSPQERAYVNAHWNQAIMERERQRAKEEAEARKRALEEQRWQQELDRRQREDQEMRRKFEQERERRRQQQHAHLRGRSRSREPSQRQQPQRSPSIHTSIPISDSTVANGNIPPPKPASPGQKPPSPKQEPRHPTPPPQYGEEHVNAASKLQHHFRIRQSLRLIKSLSSQFNTLRKEFTYPSTISLQSPTSPPTSNDVINISAITPPAVNSQSAASKDLERDDSMDVDSDSNIPKLAFNSTNYGLHAYMDSLDKLLVKLDGVESWGDRDIRARRRAVVKRIEQEQARLDRFWKDSWLNYVETQKERKEQEVSADGDVSMQAEASS